MKLVKIQMTAYPPIVADALSAADGQAMAAAFAGFVFGLGLIFSLGPQNLALIRAGITRSHPFSVASTGFVSEIALVALGIGGLGTMIGQHPAISGALQISAIGFLIWCGIRSCPLPSRAGRRSRRRHA